MNKKRFSALILTVVMLFACVGAVSFADETQTESALVYQQNALDDEMLLQRKSKAESRMRMLEEIPAPAEVQAMGDVELQASDTVTVSGTISLGSGTAAEAGKIGVYLYEVIEDGDHIKTIKSSSAVSATAEIKKGKKSATYSVTAPKGTYVVMAEYYEGKSDCINASVYYGADGSVLSRELAQPLELTANKTVNITIPKATRSISGKITFSEKITEKAWLYIYATPENSDAPEGDNYKRYAIEANTKTMEYTIGVGEGIYTLDVFSSMGDYGTYNIYGKIDNDWDSMCYISTYEKSVTNVDFTCDVVSAEEETSSSVNVKVSLPEKAESARSYSFFYESTDGNNSSRYVEKSISAGEQSFSMQASIPNGGVYVGVYDTTDTLKRYYDETLKYYYSESLGITTDKTAATPIYAESTSQINIALPESYRLKGTISRNGFAPETMQSVSVVVKWGNETFRKAVTMSRDQTSVDYTIDIPTWAAGNEACVHAEVDMGSYNSYIIEGEEVKTTLSQAMSNVNLNMPSADALVKVCGKVVLKKAAPVGGVALDISYYIKDQGYADAGIYKIAAGKNAADYSMYVPAEAAFREYGSEEKITIQVESKSADSAYNGHTTARFSREEIDDATISLLCFDQSISGEISISASVELTSGLSVIVNADIEVDGVETYVYQEVSIVKGARSAAYQMAVPSDAILNQVYMYVDNAGSLAVGTDWLYYSPDGESTFDLNLPLTNGISDVDFMLEKAKLVSGTVIIPDDFEGEAYCYIYASGNISSESTQVRIDAPGSYPFNIPVDENETSVTISAKLADWTDHNYYTGELYYSSGGMKRNYYEAEKIDVSAGSVGNINITMEKGANISGTISFQDGVYVNESADGGGVTVKLELTDKNNNRLGSKYYYNVTSAKDFEYQIPISGDASQAKMKVEISPNSANTNLPSATFYYSGDSLLSTTYSGNAKTFDATGAAVNITVPMGVKVSGKIINPADAAGRVSYGQLNFEAKVIDINTYVSVDENGYYETYIFPEEESYTVSFWPSQMTDGTNILRQSYYYVSADESTTDRNEASDVNLKNGMDNLNFHTKTGKLLSGKFLFDEDALTNISWCEIRVTNASTGDIDYEYIDGNKLADGFSFYPSTLDENGVYISYFVSYKDGADSGEVYYTSDGLSLEKDTILYPADVKDIEIKLVDKPAKITLTPVRWNLNNVNYVQAEVCVLVGEKEVKVGYPFYAGLGYQENISQYPEDIYIPAVIENQDDAFFKIATKITDPLYNQRTYYVAENGALTPDAAKAKKFQIQNMSVNVPIADSTITYSSMGDDMKMEITSAVADAENGSISVSMTVGINSWSDYVTPDYYIGVYDANKLIKVISGKYEYSEYKEVESFYTGYILTANIETEINKNYTYKLFTWNNSVAATPLLTPVNISVE